MPGKNRGGYGGSSADTPGANPMSAGGKKGAKKAAPPFAKKAMPKKPKKD